MLPVPRIVGLVTGLFGIVTAGVCIWVMEDTVKFDFLIMQTSWDGGNSPKVGITAAVLMIILGISFYFINSGGERFYFFAGALIIILALSIASMSVAIKDHENLKEAVVTTFKEDAKNKFLSFKNEFKTFRTTENININFLGYQGRRYPKPSLTKNRPINNFKEIKDKMQNRLKAVAAVGGLDTIAMAICLAVFYKYRS